MLTQEANDALDHLCSVYIGYRTSVSREAAHELLKFCDATVLIRGHMRDIKAKALGAGVWHVWLAEQELPC